MRNRGHRSSFKETITCPIYEKRLYCCIYKRKYNHIYLQISCLEEFPAFIGGTAGLHNWGRVCWYSCPSDAEIERFMEQMNRFFYLFIYLFICSHFSNMWAVDEHEQYGLQNGATGRGKLKSRRTGRPIEYGQVQQRKRWVGKNDRRLHSAVDERCNCLIIIVKSSLKNQPTSCVTCPQYYFFQAFRKT